MFEFSFQEGDLPLVLSEFSESTYFCLNVLYILKYCFLGERDDDFDVQYLEPFFLIRTCLVWG